MQDSNGFFGRRLILICGVLSAFALSACSENLSHQTPSTDHTAEVLAKVSGQSFRTGATSLGVSPDGSFELFLDADVRYFQPGQDPSSPSQESDARCLTRIVGKVSYVDPKDMFVMSTKLGAKFVVDSASVVSSATLKLDVAPVAPAHLCGRYADAVKRTKNFTQALFDFGPNFMAFVNFNFNIPDSNHGWLFYMTPHSVGTYYSVQRDNFEYVYLVKSGAQVDVTGMVLADLDGQYTTDTSGAQVAVALRVSSKQNQIFLSSESCNLVYRIEISAVTFDSDALRMKLAPTELTGFKQGVSSASSSPQCTTLKNQIQNFGTSPVEISYSARSKEGSGGGHGSGLTTYLSFLLPQVSQSYRTALEFKTK